MTRQVVPEGFIEVEDSGGKNIIIERSGNNQPNTPTPKAGDEYNGRLIKLIPSESVAAFMTAQGILLSALGTPEQQGQLQLWLWVVFLFILIVNIFYVQQRGVTSRTQIGILTVAYILWTLSLGGPFQFMAWYEPFIGPVLTVLFMFAIPNFYKGQDVLSTREQQSGATS